MIFHTPCPCLCNRITSNKLYPFYPFSKIPKPDVHLVFTPPFFSSHSALALLRVHVIRILVSHLLVNLLLLVIPLDPRPVLRRRDAPRRDPQEEVAPEVVYLVVEAVETVYR
jgi:hypothetical protein